MAHSEVVIVYSPNQARRRTVSILDYPWQVPLHAKNLQPGEASLVGSLWDYRAIGPDAMVARQMNRPASSDRYAVVNPAGYVVAILSLDPAVDKAPPGHRLHRAPSATTEVGQLARDLALLP